MGRKLTGKRPKPATLRQRRWRKRVVRGEIKAEARRAAKLAAESLPDGVDLRVGDAREVLADIAPNSVPLILTDPPYGNAAEPLYRWLGQFAARVLIPGGSLICYTGQSRLDRDLAIFSEHLRYWWLLTMPHTVPQRLLGAGVLVTFKPVLWYVKSHRRKPCSLMPDTLQSTKRDKSAHAWGQGDGGVRYLIHHLTEPGELIVDPFAGTATWGRIAASMGRRWIGADIAEGGTTTIAARSIDRTAVDVRLDQLGGREAPILEEAAN